jgi:release factor glutamine methyltransferase
MTSPRATSTIISSSFKRSSAEGVRSDRYPESVTVQEAIQEASRTIDRRDVETLLLHLLQRDRAWLFTHTDEPLSAGLQTALTALVTRRGAHEPLQYLTGVQEFYGLSLCVTPATLIPRPETEHLVEAVLEWAQRQPSMIKIVDVGTGTGAIALALAAHLPQAGIAACDHSLAALDIARENATNLTLGGRIAFSCSDLLAAYAGDTFDVIVSNPPYVPVGDAPGMQPEVRDFEPHSALFAGDDGLEVYRRLIPQAHAALRPGGLLAMEFGFGQRDALAALLRNWNDVRFIDDYAGIPRIILAER